MIFDFLKENDSDIIAKYGCEAVESNINILLNSSLNQDDPSVQVTEANVYKWADKVIEMLDEL